MENFLYQSVGRKKKKEGGWYYSILQRIDSEFDEYMRQKNCVLASHVTVVYSLTSKNYLLRKLEC